VPRLDQAPVETPISQMELLEYVEPFIIDRRLAAIEPVPRRYFEISGGIGRGSA
jgi:hypothetical protein